MAKPISATPIIRGKDAEIILAEIINGTPDTPERIELMKRADELYNRLFTKENTNETST